MYCRHSACEPEGPPEPFSIYSTLPRSLRETKLVTNVKVEEDEEVLAARQELVQSRTPAQVRLDLLYTRCPTYLVMYTWFLAFLTP